MGIAEVGLAVTLFIILFLSFVTGKRSGLTDFIKDHRSQGKEESSPFPDFIGIRQISREMIWLPDHTYMAALKCEPVNYDLKNETEQEAIDIAFDRWLSSVEWDMCWYTQSRAVDLTQQLELYRERMSGMNEPSREYGQNTIRYLESWVRSQPRFETIRYILFPYQIPGKKVSQLSEEQMTEKALGELSRRIRMTRLSLERCHIYSHPCTSQDLREMVYFAVNRRRAGLARLEDVDEYDMLAPSVTSDESGAQNEVNVHEDFPEKKAG
ncbi:MAG: hypothetical protein H0Z33_10875 [Bacillaceae bacterium]|nr:hypothetical protein [Bacillaceae bacterium]